MQIIMELDVIHEPAVDHRQDELPDWFKEANASELSWFQLWNENQCIGSCAHGDHPSCKCVGHELLDDDPWARVVFSVTMPLLQRLD